MSVTVAPRAWDVQAAAQSALQTSAIVWFVPALIGQWFFAYHVAAAFIAPAFAGNIAAWNEGLFVGLVAGDLVGNVALGAHLFIAFVITIGGTLQPIPQIRAYAPAFHRWNGRLYIVIAFVTSLAALYMIWTRDTFGGILINDISVSLNAVLIMVFAAIALRYAMARRIDVHRRWALRTFMVVSGVWFTRVIYAFLGIVPGETPGVDRRHDRPDQHRDRLRQLSAAARRARTLFPRQAQPERVRQVRHSRARARRSRGDQHRRLRHGCAVAELGSPNGHEWPSNRTETAMTLEDALAQLESLGNEKVRAQNRKRGADDNQFGVRLGDIRKIAATIKTNHELGLALWKSGNLDARLLATLVLKPKDLSADELDRMVRSGKSAPIADWLNPTSSRNTPTRRAFARVGWPRTIRGPLAPDGT